jgi:hypothetical protein
MLIIGKTNLPGSDVLKRSVKVGLGAGLLILAGLPLYALPATWTLPRGRRAGLEPLTLAEAAQQLQEAYPPGAEQIDAARALVGARMAYCRRNSFDHYARAFGRGYGYCQQMALALADLLQRLGYEASVVHCLRNRFADGKVTSHAWVRVTLGGQERDVDPLFWAEERGEIGFAPLGRVMGFSPLWRLLGGWGSLAVNAHRFYTTGRDF